jgi:hypothetical protein
MEYRDKNARLAAQYMRETIPKGEETADRFGKGGV